MKKILFFCGGSYVYGRERSMLQIMSGLQGRGWIVKNISNGWNDGHFNKLLKGEGIPFEEIKLGKISKRLHPKFIKWTLDALIHLPYALLKFRKILKKFNPDVVFFDSHYQVFWVRPFLKGYRLIIRYAEKPVLDIYLKAILKAPVRNQITHIGISQFICKELEALGVEKEKISLVYNGFPLKETSLPPSRGKEQLTFGCLGQIAPWKGQEALIEALALLKAHGIRFLCKFAGSGEDSYLDLLAKKVRDLKLEDSIIWSGYIEYTDTFFQSLDICIVPSQIEEAFGRVPMEAANFEVPSIVANVGALPEIVLDGKTGLVFKPNDPSDLSEKLLLLCKDTHLRRTLGKEARDTAVMQYSLARQLDNLETLVNKTL